MEDKIMQRVMDSTDVKTGLRCLFTTPQMSGMATERWNKAIVSALISSREQKAYKPRMSS